MKVLNQPTVEAAEAVAMRDGFKAVPGFSLVQTPVSIDITEAALAFAAVKPNQDHDPVESGIPEQV